MRAGNNESPGCETTMHERIKKLYIRAIFSNLMGTAMTHKPQFQRARLIMFLWYNPQVVWCPSLGQYLYIFICGASSSRSLS